MSIHIEIALPAVNLWKIECRSGEIGRRTGFKIPRGQPRVGSIPTSGTTHLSGAQFGGDAPRPPKQSKLLPRTGMWYPPPWPSCPTGIRTVLILLKTPVRQKFNERFSQPTSKSLLEGKYPSRTFTFSDMVSGFFWHGDPVCRCPGQYPFLRI